MDLKSIVEREVKAYAVEGWNVNITFTTDASGHEFVLIAHATERGKRMTYISLHVTLEENLVIIHQDHNDPALADTLMQVGIPREKIILAYMGESVPVGA